MNLARSLCAISLALGSCALLHAQNADQLMTTPIRWDGVEVVTNNFALIEHIRSVADFPENSTLLMSDPKLKEVCTAVRNAQSASTIACSPLIGGGSGQIPHAWYVIEVDMPKRLPLACVNPAPPLDAAFILLIDEWKTEVTRATLTTPATRDFVNESAYLDYDSPTLSKVAARIHESVRNRGRELELAGASCDPESRERAFYLMSFAGDPKRYLSLAASHILDDNAAAANAATRFLSVFADFIDARAAARISELACRSLDGSLTARNKSLSLLSQLKRRRTITLTQLSDGCQRQIGNIARTSRAELVAVPARELLEPAN